MATGAEDNKGNIPKKRVARVANIEKNKATPAHKYKVSAAGKKQAAKEK